MNYFEYGRVSMSCGTIVYSYSRTQSGYAIKLHNTDTDKFSITAGINISRERLLTIMEKLITNSVTLDNVHDFLREELTVHRCKEASESNKSGSKYLYL